MVFSSIPAYLDPSNWQQQQNHHQIIGSSGGNPLLPAPPPPPHLSGPHAPPHGGVGAGSIRPGSMAERARMANIPLPEPALKCPRCDSTNTKFCYYNNYSLSQPRHYCKMCRRYWTRGGALRSVPVGGGCRRNKRSKSSSSSKSPATSADRQTTTTAAAAATAATATTMSTYNSSSSSYNNMLGLPPLRFMSPLAQFTESFSGDQHMGLSGYTGITTPAGAAEMNFHGNFLGSQIMSSDGGDGNIEPWRMQQQFPFMGSMDQSSLPAAGTSFQFHGESSFMAAAGQSQRPKFSSSMLSQQVGSIKMEERPPQELNLSRQLLGGLLPAGNEQWSNNNNNNNNSTTVPNWTELASFSSSSTSNPL